MTALNHLEEQLLSLLLDGDVPQLEILRRQLALADVSGRDFSGVGFFTKFELPTGAPRVEPPNFVLGDISFQLENVENGGEALLFVRDGVLDILEVYNWTDDWPQLPKLVSTSYLRPAQELPANPVSLVPTSSRDYEFVKMEIAGHVHDRPSA